MNTLTLYWAGKADELRGVLADGCFPDPCPPWDKVVALVTERHLTSLDGALAKAHARLFNILRVEIWLPEDLQVERYDTMDGVIPLGMFLFPIPVVNKLVRSMAAVPRDWVMDPVRQKRWKQQKRDHDDLCAAHLTARD